ncbi:amidohydrolase family protein [Streptomyces pseudovenezuelae]|uniref:Cytosine/adenosine deaminase-related metal-dependent hydrolase n=1 Tax=Streptomyces pseudovenezuelae TaxID=67350 RepID=A0ABT6LQK9_9ACTN|nr:amidohydrolase family protein [Streptomyces pseudovenezuelae]MDH6218104.1 cytosine/adenosine deaminase-related metal-dependent hydrolase [Streptomyces pseudovenezuelae]
MNTDDTTSASLLEQLRRQSTDPRRRILFTGATIVTMDPDLGILHKSDLLVEGETIAAIGPDLSVEGAVVVDASGTILAPGLVDTHRHAWEAQLRRIMPDVDDLGGYVMTTLAGYATIYRPEDMYIGTKLAALTALDSGITTMLDFSHNSRTREHSDAAIEALRDTGIRGVHASMGPHFGDWDRQWPADLTRLKDQYFSSDDQLLTLRMATLATDEIAGPVLAYGPELARTAADLGIGVSVDAVFGKASSEAVLSWAEHGILGPDVTLIHSTGLTTEAWKAMGESGTTVAQIGLETAIPAVDEALAVGIRPGLSIDVEVALASDLFTQMRALLAIQRMRAVNAAYGRGGDLSRITTHDVLDFATLQGARTNGLGGVTGSLTPGKKADLLVVQAEDLNNMPLNDPIGTLVLGSDPRNITAVLVNGRPLKWNGEVLDVNLPALRAEVNASRTYVLNTPAA